MSYVVPKLVGAQQSCLRAHSALSRASSRQKGGNEWELVATFFPSRVLPIYLCHVRPRSPGCAPDLQARGGSVGTVGQHSIVTRPRAAEGHIS